MDCNACLALGAFFASFANNTCLCIKDLEKVGADLLGFLKTEGSCREFENDYCSGTVSTSTGNSLFWGILIGVLLGIGLCVLAGIVIWRYRDGILIRVGRIAGWIARHCCRRDHVAAEFDIPMEDQVQGDIGDAENEDVSDGEEGCQEDLGDVGGEEVGEEVETAVAEEGFEEDGGEQVAVEGYEEDLAGDGGEEEEERVGEEEEEGGEGEDESSLLRTPSPLRLRRHGQATPRFIPENSRI